MTIAHYLRVLYLFIFLSLLSCNETTTTNKQINEAHIIERVQSLIKESRDKKLSLDIRHLYIDSTLTDINSIDSKTLKNRLLLKASYSLYKLKDSVLFIETVNKSLNLSKALRDTSAFARANMYKAFFYDDSDYNELAYSYYYNANNLFYKIGDFRRYGAILTKIGNLETGFHQYHRAENSLTSSVDILNKIENKGLLISNYNRLGNLKYVIKDYNASLDYFNESKEYLLEYSPLDSLSLSAINNNIGNCYTKLGNYTAGIKHFNQAISYSDLITNKKQNYRISDNLIHCKFLNGDQMNFDNEFNINRNNKENIKDYSGIITNRIYFSEYLRTRNRKSEAIESIKEALLLSRKINNKYSELECLEELINIEDSNYKNHFNDYINLKQELEDTERQTENKLGFVRMETEMYKSQSVNLTKEKEWLIVVISLLLILTIIIIYFYKQRINLINVIKDKREKEIIQELMAKNNLEIIKAKNDANKKLSRELHDDILSRLFGVRYNLKLLNSKSDESTLKQRELFLKELIVIEKDLRIISHELKGNVEYDFKKAVEQLCNNTFSKTIIYHTISSRFSKWKYLEEKQKIGLYRIIQEIVTNIMKHANADKVWISFDLIDEKLVTTVLDNGIGFDINKKYRGIGIQNINERANEINSIVNYDSNKGEGTTISIITELEPNTKEKSTTHK